MGSDSTPVIKGPFPGPDRNGTGESSAPPSTGGAAVLLHLTGPHRGTRQRLTEAEALVGTSPDAVVHFPDYADPAVASRHALLVRTEDGWTVREEEGQVYLNSADVPGLHGREALAPGDIIEIGSGGPVLRFVMETHDSAQYKSMKEAFQSLPRELLTRTAPRTRLAVSGLLVLVVASVGTLAAYGLRLERRIEAEEQRSATVAEALGSLTDLPAGDPELRILVGELEAVLTQRIEALEALSDAGRRVVMAASSSVMFVQGGYHFLDPESDRPLRLLLGRTGSPRMGPNGMPLTTLEGDGPVFEFQFTGSAWLATEDGLLITNRHVAIPWSANEQVRPLFEQGYRPVVKLRGYLPDQAEPIQLEFVTASEEMDLAVVRAPDLVGREPLELAEANPSPGQPILVLGYPAGIDALLARSGAMFVDSLMQRRPDFWTVVQRLSEAGFIRPLATQGIVGQVTPSTIAYDAETTRGGSGGPVLSLDGQVVAVTFAIMADFGGSNLGVPVEEVSRLLARASQESRDGAG